MTIKQQATNAPNSPGVYQFFDQNDQALYVGKAKNLKKRLKSYYVDPKRLNNRISRMVSLATQLEIITTTSQSEALLLECNLIKKLKPRYNILLRDDKSFPYILITGDHKFPQISKHRGKRVKKGHYFGPFAHVRDVNTTINILKKAFLLRCCSNAEFKRRQKPCLEYQIKKCSAPCVNFIDNREYNDLVQEAVNFLNGKNSKIQEKLAIKMQSLSKKHKYEQAAIIRDRIKALCAIQATQNINLNWLNNADTIALARNDNLCCIYISFYRSGHNYGSKPYFINVSQEIPETEIISTFLGQFYLDQIPPPTIILSHKPEDQETISKFLNNLAKQYNSEKKPKEKINIIIPAKGKKFNLIKACLTSAQQQLQRKLNNQMDNQKMLIQLKQLLNLAKIPKRIEVYDNSHISGQYMVGAMISADSKGFIKSGYRKFNIRENELSAKDDTALLKQVLSRRFTNSSNQTNKTDLAIPDLIIIDGGKGQLSAAQTVFEQLNIKDQAYICMSKGKDRNAGKEWFHQVGQESFTLPPDNPVLHYLQRLRDEAHRFAIDTHRKKRAKSMNKSQLDEIDNIGKNRKTLLLNHFGSIAAVKEASLEDLYRIPGISKNIAGRIKNYFS